MAVTLPLLDASERQIADTSILAYQDLLPTLPAKRMTVLMEIARYLARTGYEDVTGGELCAATGLPILTVRPRLTELVQAGLLVKGPVRASRVASEKHCHGVRPTLPLAAIERAMKEAA